MFEMAASRPAEQISVSELADRAGVSRRTFYRHAGSPVEFLSHLLAEEHRELEETLVDTLLMPTQESSDAWKAAYAVMLDHVDRRLGS